MVDLINREVLQFIYTSSEEDAYLLLSNISSSLYEAESDVVEKRIDVNSFKEIIDDVGYENIIEIKKRLKALLKKPSLKANQTELKENTKGNSTKESEEYQEKVKKLIDESEYLSAIEKEALWFVEDKAQEYPLLEQVKDSTRWRHYKMAQCKLHILRKLAIS